MNSSLCVIHRILSFKRKSKIKRRYVTLFWFDSKKIKLVKINSWFTNVMENMENIFVIECHGNVMESYKNIMEKYVFTNSVITKNIWYYSFYNYVKKSRLRFTCIFLSVHNNCARAFGACIYEAIRNLNIARMILQT